MTTTDHLPRGASAWDVEMYAYLTGHAAREGELLGSYLDAVEATESKALRYLVDLLAADERRHHQLFEELAASLKADAELSFDDPVVPRMDFHRGDTEQVLEVTRRLIANEEADAAELKRLRRSLRDMEDTTLWALLVETMQLDTAKHLAVLRFVEDHTQKRRH